MAMPMLRPHIFYSNRELSERIYPKRMAAFEDFRTVVNTHVIGGYAPESPIIHPDTRMVSLGSCFAQHVAEFLQGRQMDITHHFLSERLFTTHALDYFIRCICNKQLPEDLVRTEGDVLSEADMLTIHEKFTGGCTTIITLGMAMRWFHIASGQPCYEFPEGANLHDYEMRLTTVEENLANLKRLVETLWALNPANQIILTLSPIPLIYSKCDYPVMVADNLSKSTLRLAIDQLGREVQSDRLYYYPSFEMVRCAAPVKGRVWGLDDDDPRHVSKHFVAFIMQLFWEHFVGETEKTAAAQQEDINATA